MTVCQTFKHKLRYMVYVIHGVHNGRNSFHNFTNVNINLQLQTFSMTSLFYHYVSTRQIFHSLYLSLFHHFLSLFFPLSLYLSLLLQLSF